MDLCLFHKFDDGEVEMVMVVHADDIIAHANYQETMEMFAAELGRKFSLKEMVDASNTRGCRPSLK